MAPAGRADEEVGTAPSPLPAAVEPAPDTACDTSPVIGKPITVGAAAPLVGKTGTARQPWPATLPEQVAIVAQALSDALSPLAVDQLAER